MVGRHYHLREDFQLEETYFEKACSMNYGDGCYHLGVKYARRNYKLAKMYYEKACNLNVVKGCLDIGRFYLLGRGVRQDYQKAKTYFDKACSTLKHGPECCYKVGNYYSLNLRDYQQAKTYYEKSCNLNDAQGCFNLGMLYEDGKGVSQNFQTAKEYYGKACDLGNEDNDVAQFYCDGYRKLNEKGY